MSLNFTLRRFIRLIPISLQIKQCQEGPGRLENLTVLDFSKLNALDIKVIFPLKMHNIYLGFPQHPTLKLSLQSGLPGFWRVSLG